MIKKISSNKKTFKDVTFKDGFNVILSERDEKATDRDSRNGLGKSTLIDIIHFCLGSRSLGSLSSEALKDWSFMMELHLNKKDYVVKRNIAKNNYVELTGDFSNWPIKPEKNNLTDSFTMPINDWTKILGLLYFNLPIGDEEKYRPTYRSLISYLIRRGIEAFNEPFKYFAEQKVWDIQVNNAYLLGLNWSYVIEFQKLKDRENTLRSLKAAAEAGLLSGFVGTLGELEAEKVRLEEEYAALNGQIKTFKVHPEYYHLQEDANTLTENIHSLTNRLTINQQILDKYHDNLMDEKDVSLENVEKIYKEAGVVFSDNVLKKINEVTDFHRKIIENRKSYLETEIDRLGREIEKDKEEIESTSNNRAQIFTILTTHGAFEEYSQIQNVLLTVKQTLEEVKNRIENYRKFQEYRSEINIQKEELLQKMNRDYKERVEEIDSVRSQFNKNSNFLYSEPGIFSIEISQYGYSFNVEIKRAASQGIGHMKIFSYDLTIAQNLVKKIYPSNISLIHDSTVFDGVDERQIAKALELAYQESSSKNFQYICLLNSDTVPHKDFSKNFGDLFSKSIRETFTDATPEGGLLGIRF